MRASAVRRSAVSAPEPRTSISRPESVAVVWMSSGLPVGFQRFGNGPGRPNRAAKAGRQDRAAVDGDDVVRARRRKADLQNVMGAAPRMQHRAPAARAMGIDQIVDRRDHIRLRQCLHHQRAFPQVVFGQRPVLHRAAAAGTEMFAKRLDALVAAPVDMQQMPAVRMAGNRLDRDGLARQRIRHIDGPFGVSATPSPR